MGTSFRLILLHSEGVARVLSHRFAIQLLAMSCRAPQLDCSGSGPGTNAEVEGQWNDLRGLCLDSIGFLGVFGAPFESNSRQRVVRPSMWPALGVVVFV